MADLIRLSDTEFQKIRDLVYQKVGITLNKQKKSLVVGRLQKILRKNGFINFDQYLNHVVNDTTGNSLVTLVDRISTNHTFFYREFDHFEYFSKKILPAVKRQFNNGKAGKIRLWCAGCSSGEEPYTLSMLIDNFLGSEASKWDIGILATDISVSALEKAKTAIYSDENVERLPSALKSKYLKSAGTGQWTIEDKIKKRIMYKRLNLMRPEYPFKGKFQIIFCRNVMIYFDLKTREELVEKFHRYTENAGYLFIGHSETLGRGNQFFEYLQPAVYQKK